jgi:hypothetical protein
VVDGDKIVEDSIGDIGGEEVNKNEVTKAAEVVNDDEVDNTEKVVDDKIAALLQLNTLNI